MSFTYRYRKIIIISIVVLILIGVGGFYLYKEFLPKNNKKKESLVISEKEETKKKSSEAKTTEEYYKVDIKGEVINPGLYSLKVGSRVSDVITLAGGLTDIGDTTVINLSKKITDEMVIIIYSIYEVSEWEKTKELENTLVENCEDWTSIHNDACIKTDNTINVTSGKISLNNATKEELMTLSGIGEAKAESIIKYRDDHGGFTDINELKDINGIGDSIFDKIKEDITL